MALENSQHLTREGIQKFQEELDFLSKVKMEEIKEKLQEARAQGDLSENAEYDAAREEQAQTFERIQELQFILKNAVVIESEGGDVVQIGSTVTFVLKNDGVTQSFKIVGSAEADPFTGKISNESPVALAVLGRRVGDVEHVNLPEGSTEVEILEVV
ncbi:MAG: transcription elongation factor GreA [Turicibacter sp.]|nr:transcription elongation factor GreA [Turicibacter sp.]